MFVIIDIETAGHSYMYGKITEIALYQHNGVNISNSYSKLIKPDMDIPYFITELTATNSKMGC